MWFRCVISSAWHGQMAIGDMSRHISYYSIEAYELYVNNVWISFFKPINRGKVESNTLACSMWHADYMIMYFKTNIMISLSGTICNVHIEPRMRSKYVNHYCAFSSSFTHSLQVIRVEQNNNNQKSRAVYPISFRKSSRRTRNESIVSDSGYSPERQI